MDNTYLLRAVEKIAKEKYSGHYTLYSFTTNYKGCFGTPIMDYEELNMFLWVSDGYKSMQELLYKMSENPDLFNCSNFTKDDFEKAKEKYYIKIK